MPTFVLLFVLTLFVSSDAKPVQDNAGLARARDHSQKGEYEQAISLFEDLISDATGSVLARIGLINVLLATGDYQEAEKNCRRVLDKHPGHPDAATKLGDILYRRGRYSEARTQYKEVVAAQPDYLAARLRLGEMQWQWGEKDKARATLQYFISYYRQHPRLTAEQLSLIAQACIYLDRFRDANSLFNEATKTDKNYWQAYVPWGELMLSKYNISDAKGIFQDALQANPNAAEAHLGMARVLKSSEIPLAIAAAEKALEINPNLAAAHSFLAELRIAMGRPADAKEHIKNALAINDKSLSARTLQALAYYLSDEKASFAAEERKILSINPAYADLYYELAELLARRYLFQESVVYYRKATALDPEHWSAYSGLGTSLSRLGDEDGARLELERSFKKDPFNKHVGNLLTLFDEFDQYESHKSRHLTLRLHEDDDPVLGPYARELADDSFSHLLQSYSIDMSQEVILEIFPTHDDFAVRCFGIPGAQAFLGICFGNVVAMDSPRARPKGDFVWGETLWHELVHVTHLRLTQNRIPRWLAEGIAVYETSHARPYWSMNLDMPFILAFKNGKTLPLKELDSGFNRPTSPGQVTLSYFQASLIVEFIVEKYGREKLLATFPKFKTGSKTPAVIEDVFGREVDDFDAGFHAYVRKKYRFTEVDYDYDSKANAGRPDDLGDLLIDGLAEKPNNPLLNFKLGLFYKKNGDQEGAIVYLQRTKELVPWFAEKENPYKALAEIYAEQGRKPEAISELQALTALNAKDLQILEMLASFCLEEGDFECAVSALQKAIYIAPFDSGIHQKLARAHLALGQNEEAVRELRVNLLTHPDDLAEAHCDLAATLLKTGNTAEAKIEALAALEIAPNYERAQEILLATID